MLVVLVIGLIFAATRYGAVGCGLVWTAVVSGALLFYAPIVHHKFAPNLHARWLMVDIAPIAGAVTVAAAMLSAVVHISQDRFTAIVELTVVGGAVLVVGIAASSAARTWLVMTWRRMVAGQSIAG
jgi:hypothetical protein